MDYSLSPDESPAPFGVFPGERIIHTASAASAALCRLYGVRPHCSCYPLLFLTDRDTIIFSGIALSGN